MRSLSFSSLFVSTTFLHIHFLFFLFIFLLIESFKFLSGKDKLVYEYTRSAVEHEPVVEKLLPWLWCAHAAGDSLRQLNMFRTTWIEENSPLLHQELLPLQLALRLQLLTSVLVALIPISIAFFAHFRMPSSVLVTIKWRRSLGLERSLLHSVSE